MQGFVFNFYLVCKFFCILLVTVRFCSIFVQVYTTLAATVLLSAVGVYIHTLLNIGGIITSLLFVAASAWLAATPHTPQDEVCSVQIADYKLKGLGMIMLFTTSM